MDSSKKGIKNVNCKNLWGIDNDYKHIKGLCDKLNYELYETEKDKFQWKRDEIISFLKQSAQHLEQNIMNEQDPKKKYDALFAVISGHGYDKSIISSDYQLITKQAIHSLFSWNHATSREIPRVFVFDCCDGIQEQDTDYAGHYRDEEESSSEEEDEEKEHGKANFGANDILERQNTLVWKKGQDNPDYRLCVVHAANEGFQSKMSNETGSYLITAMTDKMIDNVDHKCCFKKFEFFGEIIDAIQKNLHDKGKQQVNGSFNNHTRKLKFKKHQGIKYEDEEIRGLEEVQRISPLSKPRSITNMKSSTAKDTETRNMNDEDNVEMGESEKSKWNKIDNNPESQGDINNDKIGYSEGIDLEMIALSTGILKELEDEGSIAL